MNRPAVPSRDPARPATGDFAQGRNSLRQRLVLPLLSLWVASALAASGAAYWLAGRSTDLSFDRLLTDDARALAAQLRWSGARASFVADPETADSLVFDSLARTHYLVRTAAGRTLAGDLAIDGIPADAAATATAPGVAQVFDLPTSAGVLRAVALRLVPRPDDEAVWVVVAESKAARRHVSQEIALAIFLPAALAGFVIVPLLFWGVRRGLAPARRITAEVAQHGLDDLSPLPTDNVPQELRALVQHTNELVFRLKASIDEQRRFVADAAHQLQTPVAGIRLLVGDMRRIQRADPLQPADGEVLAQLDEVAVRAARMVRQLLAFARAENDTVVEDEVFDCLPVLQEVVERWRASPAAAGKRLRLSTGPGGTTDREGDRHTLRLRGSPTLLGEVVSNLVDNALRYGGCDIVVSLAPSPAGVRIAVSDDGATLDADTHAAMLLPFWRGSHGQPEGSGLGLSIAQRVVQRMDGRLTVGTAADGSGTAVVLQFPAAVA